MPVDATILAIDAKIVALRTAIENAEDKLSSEVSAQQAEIDKLIAQRYARLVEIEKQIKQSWAREANLENTVQLTNRERTRFNNLLAKQKAMPLLKREKTELTTLQAKATPAETTKYPPGCGTVAGSELG
jgi:hypothetical protein